MGQLTNMTLPPPSGSDLNGNRNSTGYATTSDNLMTSDGTFNYQHDADGNTTVRTRISPRLSSGNEYWGNGPPRRAPTIIRR